MSRFSVWLQVSEPYLLFFNQVLKELAKSHQTPVFEPHLTVLSGVLNPSKFSKDSFEKHRPILLKTERLSESKEFFQGIFLEFRENSKINRLQQHCLRQLEISDVSIKQPHLSLLYGKFVKKERLAIIKKLNIKLPQKIEFDRISLFITEGKVEEWKKVKTVFLKKR